MNRIKHLLVLSMIVIIFAASLKDANERFIKGSNQQTQINGSVVDGQTNTVTEIDEKILIDDHENPVTDISKIVVQKPYITAESYIVANLETGERYIDFNSHAVFPIASVSKLYTALVVHHLFDLNSKITITDSILNAYGDAGHLVLGEKFTPDELLHALLLESSNDAALAFAESFDLPATTTTKFMEEMNAFAKEIGMDNTHFRDSSGISPSNVSNAADLFTLSQYLYKSEKDILHISKTQEMSLSTTTDHGSHKFININPFSHNPEFVGGKTGRTGEAKEAMVSIFDKEVKGIQYPIVIIVLRSDVGEREINTEKLLSLFIKQR